MEHIPDMLDPPPIADEYNKIKQRLLSIYQRPSGERLAEMIDATSLGGLRPSARRPHHRSDSGHNNG